MATSHSDVPNFPDESTTVYYSMGKLEQAFDPSSTYSHNPHIPYSLNLDAIHKLHIIVCGSSQIFTPPLTSLFSSELVSFYKEVKNLWVGTVHESK